jgi:hypothetical protein
MSELATERVYLRTGTAIVTSARAVLNGVTYFIANIASVRLGKAGDDFVVLLDNAGREVNGLESKDKEEVKKVVDAISRAIVARA